MGALATLAPWTPEDDLLLKNAVEAGASLESLAKGAVQFSQRFTVREIQDRWYSLLYDPIISAEASACMSNFELSALPLPSKFSKLGRSKERKLASVKRKTESVRSSYYAMRKRICNDTFTSMDLSFMVGLKNSNCLGNGGEPSLENCMPEGAATYHSKSQGSNFGPMHCALPENMMDGSGATNGVTAHAFYTGVENPVEESFHIEQKNILKEVEEPQILGEKVHLNGGIEELGGPKELAVDALIGDDGLERMPLSTFDQIDSEPGNLCSEFDGNHVFDSPDLECGTSFNTLQLSPLPEMPIWRTDEGILGPDMPCDNLENTVACGEAYLAELSNSLLDLTNDEEFYLADVDGQDRFDESYYDGLSSLLLNSPVDISQDQIPRIAGPEILVVSQGHVTNPSILCHAEINDNMGSCSSDVQVVHKSEVCIPSFASAKDPRFPELINGVVCCTLNTEDPEIPSNDDVFLPFDVPPSTVPSSSKWTFQEANKPLLSSVEDFGPSHRAGERGIHLVQVEQKNPHMMESPPLPGPVGGSHVKCELPNNCASHMSRTAVTVHANPKEEATNIVFAKHQSNDLKNSSNEKPAHGSNSFRNYPHLNASGMKQEQDVVIPIQDHQSLLTELGSSDFVRSELVANPPTSDWEEQNIDSEDDIPYYSNIEAMILDMDLDPDDQDLYCSVAVSRYQHQDTKRAILRLEQGAQSYMQRALASHGAFAILYGRHSKHYIKKPEVLLGRASEDVPVDIDLGKEGCANKISRRQAIINLDKVGYFYLKNLGRSSILVNNKEVQPSHSQRLHSSCLIEIRGMPFIFETNQSCVKRYLDRVAEDDQTP